VTRSPRPSAGALINTRLQGMRRDELIAALRDAHSEEFVVMFLGFLMARIPELIAVDQDRLLLTWAAFKAEMGAWMGPP
jgi:hypothetical protein